MAACLITISGTSGQVTLKYKIAAIPKSLTTGIGSIYIEDTATEVTYTTISGDATAASLCLTITNLPYVCYNMAWTGLKNTGYKIDRVILGGTSLVIADTNFPRSDESIISAINALNNDNVKITKYLITNRSAIYTGNEDQVIYSYIIRILGSDIPQFRVKNSTNTGYIYIHGVSSTCTPVGYLEAPDNCIAS